MNYNATDKYYKDADEYTVHSTKKVPATANSFTNRITDIEPPNSIRNEDRRSMAVLVRTACSGLVHK